MYLNKIKIFNYKCFDGEFTLDLSDGLNILVGDNESGKSTILEAINLALSGLIDGRYLKLELTPHLFNNNVRKRYIESLDEESDGIPIPPEIIIELFFDGVDDDAIKALFEGDGNSTRTKQCGIKFKIALNETYKEFYEELIKQKDIQSIPTEYYEFSWSSFARNDRITPKTIPIKSAPIDSSNNKYKNGSDIYISRILKDHLEDEDKIKVDQAYRKLKDEFGSNDSIINVNKIIENAIDISDKKVEIALDLSVNAWETSLITFLDDVPFHYIGKGEQCIVKTRLALNHKKALEANVLLLEEPENHLSYTKLNNLLSYIKKSQQDKQIIVSTHSSFVANKLGLDTLIMINVNADTSQRENLRLNELEESTNTFFEKLSGYDTLRLILCRKAILVEGDSDELIVQKAYLNKYGVLPIENFIDVISVGTSFLRFLEIADKIKKEVCVVTDNDGDYDNKITKKYGSYKDSGLIKLCAEQNDVKYSLEPNIVDVNTDQLDLLREVLGIDLKKYPDSASIIKYMENNKTECALKIFESDKDIKLPKYILDAVE